MPTKIIPVIKAAKPLRTKAAYYIALDGTKIPKDVPGALESLAQANRLHLDIENLRVRCPDNDL